MKITYKNHNLKPESLEKVATVAAVIEDFRLQGYTLSLRQLYYQLVAQNLVVNSVRSYKNLGRLITKAREAGLLSWTSIEDRERNASLWQHNEDEKEVLNGLEYGYSIDRWARQEHYVEAWIEKEALVDVLRRACQRWKVPYLACKGYVSASELWRAGRRFHAARKRGKRPVLLHLGDHDPSGIDMTRDNDDRLWLYSGFDNVEVRRLALNMDQVDEHDPPPNPAKVSDSRYRDYVLQYGRESWELDALRPSVIVQIVEAEIQTLIDRDAWEECDREETGARRYLSQVHERWDDIKGLMDEHGWV